MLTFYRSTLLSFMSLAVVELAKKHTLHRLRQLTELNHVSRNRITVTNLCQAQHEVLQGSLGFWNQRDLQNPTDLRAPHLLYLLALVAAKAKGTTDEDKKTTCQVLRSLAMSQNQSTLNIFTVYHHLSIHPSSQGCAEW